MPCIRKCVLVHSSILLLLVLRVSRELGCIAGNRRHYFDHGVQEEMGKQEARASRIGDIIGLGKGHSAEHLDTGPAGGVFGCPIHP